MLRIVLVGGIALFLSAQMLEVVRADASITMMGFVYPYRVSDDGTTAVGFTDFSRSGLGHPFLWNAQVGVVELHATDTQDYGVAKGVSADGSLVFGTTVTDGLHQSFVWSPDLGFQFPQLDVGENISADGRNLLGYIYHEGGYIAGIVDGGGALTQIPRLDVTDNYFLVPHALTPDATVAVGICGNEAFRWSADTGSMGLGDLPGGRTYSRAFDVSADGAVVVGESPSDESGDSPEAFRWTAETGMVGLGDLPFARFSSTAHAVSADGSIIVGAGSGTHDQTAIIWDEVHGMRRLRSVLESEYGLLEELRPWWNLELATDISADGRTIVGIGRVEGNRMAGWIVHLPEPSSPDYSWDLKQVGLRRG